MLQIAVTNKRKESKKGDDKEPLPYYLNLIINVLKTPISRGILTILKHRI